jgi:hypothetical protein
MSLVRRTLLATIAIVPLGSIAAQAQSISETGTGGIQSASATDIAKKLENPIGDITSIPLQNNTNLGVGPRPGTQNVLNFQPVVPLHIDRDWNVIVRAVMPFTWSPTAQPAQSVPFGIAPTTVSAFLSPVTLTDGWAWGIGPIVQVPAITSTTLGSNVWGLGPTAVIVKQDGPIVAGLLISDTFSFGGTSGPTGSKYNLFNLKPLFNYNFGDGWFIGSVPVITADWSADGEKWTLPVGVEFGRVIKIDNEPPINVQGGVYYNALRPEGAATWQFRTQIGVVF